MRFREIKEPSDNICEDDTEDFMIEDIPSDETCKIIRISEKEKARLISSFRRSLIIKLVGKIVGFRILEKKLNLL